MTKSRFKSVVNSVTIPFLIWSCFVYVNGLPVVHAEKGRDDRSQVGATDANDDGRDEFCRDGQTCSNVDMVDYCRQNSQTSLALQMANLSSPKGSLSYQKTKRILSNHKHFYIDLKGAQGIFDSVTRNLVTMLKTYGLERVESPMAEERILIIETVFTDKTDENGTPFVKRPNTSVIVIQTEQVCCTAYAQPILPYFKARHSSPDCAIWEYSDQNLRWLQEQHFGDSVLLLPTMHQSRLEPHLPETPKSLSERSLDVVFFFGALTPRRKTIVPQLQAMATNRWNISLEEVQGSKLLHMAQRYADSRICLVILSYGDTVPGEYHRLSEMAKSGCIPVMETFGDEFGKDVYEKCGGVVFSDLGTMPFAIANANVLENLHKHEASLSQRGEWWGDRVQWDQLLNMIFD